MNRRWICNDLLMDMFPFFDRPQLGLKLALLSPRFNALVDKHFDGKTELTIWRQITIDEKGTNAKLSVLIGRKFVHFPLPYRPLPNKIRFNCLFIEYIDHSVIAFLRANQHIWDKGTNLNLYMNANKSDDQSIWNALFHEIWPIFVPNIRHLTFPNGHHLYDLRRYISPTILIDLTQLVSINSCLLPDLVAYDGPSASAGQALSKWLNTPTKNGQPKQLICCGDTSKTTELINNFKEAFLRATTSSASYIIRIKRYLFESTPVAPFELTNERTNEMLTLEKEDEYNDVGWQLKRCQIGATDQWENKTTDNLNNIHCWLYEDSIGPLSPPKAGQMNEESHLEMNPGPSGEQKKK